METEQVARQSLATSARLAEVLVGVSERFLTWLLTSGVRIILIALIAASRR